MARRGKPSQYELIRAKGLTAPDPTHKDYVGTYDPSPAYQAPGSQPAPATSQPTPRRSWAFLKRLGQKLQSRLPAQPTRVPMTNPRTFLNRRVLKPDTIAKIEAMGELASQVADRWAGGWPKRVKKAEREGRLLAAIESQCERERPAREYEAENPWAGGIETRQLFDLRDEPPF